jgi:ABC-2 type transport system ATP-binding protein
MLNAEHLTLAYGDRIILGRASFVLPDAGFIGVIGANGTGKSTLLRALAGLKSSMSGTLCFNGVPISAGRNAAAAMTGYALEPGALPMRLTGRQALTMIERIRRVGCSDELAKLATTLKLSALLDTPIGRYSLGTQQKLAILLALTGAPKLVLLDESLNGLDPVSALALKRFLRGYVDRHQALVLLATHAIGAVERFCDGLLLLGEGGALEVLDHASLQTLRAGDRSVEDALVERLTRGG